MCRGSRKLFKPVNTCHHKSLYGRQSNVPSYYQGTWRTYVFVTVLDGGRFLRGKPSADNKTVRVKGLRLSQHNNKNNSLMNVVYFCFHTFSFYFHYQYKLFPIIKKKLHHLFIKLKGLSKY